jgi:ATP-dependent Clp protease ATP-binding subunit ClpA
MIVFRQLEKSDMAEILELELAKVVKRLEQKGKKLVLSKGSRDFLIEQGFDPSLGARPLRRAIEKYIENPLAEEILRGGLADGEVVEVVTSGDELVFRQKAASRK